MRNFKRSESPRMHKAICDKCGASCELPFKPSNDKPVYCSSCFEKKGRDSGSRFQDSRDSGSRFQDKRMHKAICDKCGADCELPFRPSGDKPVYCSSCFGKSEGSSSRPSSSSPQFKQDNSRLESKLEQINSNLEKILKVLNPEKKEIKEVEKKVEKKKIELKVKKEIKLKPKAKKAKK